MGSGHLFQTLIEENTAYDHEVYMIIALQLQLDIYTTIEGVKNIPPKLFL